MNVLLVATEQQWLGTARMPHDLATAGWSVALLAPRGTLAERSGFVGKIAHLPDNATPLQWVHAFAGTVRAVGPRFVIPCDDVSFRLLAMLHSAPPVNLQRALHTELAALIERSLGDPAHYHASVDKTLISPAAEAAGVRVPPYAIVEDAAAAERFAALHGFPVVLKRGYSSGSLGVAVCADPAALYREFARLATAPGLDLGDAHARRYLVQAFVPGPTRYFAATAWQGELLCGYAVDKIAGDPGGPASVVRDFDRPGLFESVARLTRALGVTGVFAPEYIVDARTGEDMLVEINRRVTPGTHRGELFGMSSGAALLAALQGAPSPIRARLAPGEELFFVSFPHEWLRDPRSPYLRRSQYIVDVPWDDPELVEAFLAERHR